MPFFPDDNKQLNIKNRIIYKNVTLQVRKSLRLKKYRSKRVLLSASCLFSGSLTIEASLGISLFIFAAVCLMMPFKMMNIQRQVQCVLESVGEMASQYSYVIWQLELESGKEEVGEQFKNEALAYATEAAVIGCVYYQLTGLLDERAIRSVSFTRSEIMEDGETIRLIMDYELVLPFSVFQLDSISMTSICSRRAWIGRDGQRGKGGSIEEGDITVYIGRAPQRYHLSSKCHYLSNEKIEGVFFDQVSMRRNKNGEKYAPCKKCGGNAASSEKVYIMPSGSSYHSERFCSAVIAYVQAVPLSSVKHLGACSYCGGG